jgi:hypothetical protein
MTQADGAGNHEDINYDPYGDFSILVLGYVAFPVELFGLVANILSIRIFTHKYMKNNPINW